MKKLFIWVAMLCMADAYAWDLHYGEYAVNLTATKNTSPALHIRLNENETIYGAMYDAAGAPKNTIRIMFEGTEYFVGNWCDAGKYQSSDKLECVDCGIGHYCTGGVHRAPCRGGAIACPGKNHTADAVADASLVNKMLSLDEANEYIPATDLSQWERVSLGCGQVLCQVYNPDNRNNPNCACHSGIIGPGTYLFVERYNYGSVNIMAANIAVFDHPVGYMSVHAHNLFETVIDTEHAPFQSWTLNTPNYNDNINACNVPGVWDLGHGIYVYELK